MPGFWGSGACQEVWGSSSWNPKEGPLAGEGGCCQGGIWSLLRGALHGEVDLLPNKKIFVFRGRILYWVCVGERDSTDHRCWEDPSRKPFLMNHKLYYFLDLKELVISLSKFNHSWFIPVRSTIQQVLTAHWSPQELDTCFNAFEAMVFHFFLFTVAVFLMHWSLPVPIQHKQVSRAACRSQGFIPCLLEIHSPRQLKSHQKLQGNIMWHTLPVKNT